MEEIPAIPTRYLGIQFRSRLEAKWAAFFTLIGWRWEYEPIDLGGYIPDFIVEHPASDWLAAPAPVGWPFVATSRLVEVKPVTDSLLLTEQAAKIEASGWDGEAAIVGASLWPHEPAGALLGVQMVRGPRIGWGDWLIVPRVHAMRAWREAANQVQWKRTEAA